MVWLLWLPVDNMHTVYSAVLKLLLSAVSEQIYFMVMVSKKSVLSKKSVVIIECTDQFYFCIYLSDIVSIYSPLLEVYLHKLTYLNNFRCPNH